MEVSYKSKKLETYLSDEKKMQRRFGVLAKKLKLRIKQLKAAENLAIMHTFPSARCHELKGERKGQLCVNVSGNYRLIFEPNHNPTPKKEDGGLKWSGVSQITMLEVEDIH